MTGRQFAATLEAMIHALEQERDALNAKWSEINGPAMDAWLFDEKRRDLPRDDPGEVAGRARYNEGRAAGILAAEKGALIDHYRRVLESYRIVAGDLEALDATTGEKWPIYHVPYSGETPDEMFEYISEDLRTILSRSRGDPFVFESGVRLQVRIGRVAASHLALSREERESADLRAASMIRYLTPAKSRCDRCERWTAKQDLEAVGSGLLLCGPCRGK